VFAKEINFGQNHYLDWDSLQHKVTKFVFGHHC